MYHRNIPDNMWKKLEKFKPQIHIEIWTYDPIPSCSFVFTLPKVWNSYYIWACECVQNSRAVNSLVVSNEKRQLKSYLTWSKTNSYIDWAKKTFEKTSIINFTINECWHSMYHVYIFSVLLYDAFENLTLQVIVCPLTLLDRMLSHIWNSILVGHSWWSRLFNRFTSWYFNINGFKTTR